MVCRFEPLGIYSDGPSVGLRIHGAKDQEGVAIDVHVQRAQQAQQLAAADDEVLRRSKQLACKVEGFGSQRVFFVGSHL